MQLSVPYLWKWIVATCVALWVRTPAAVQALAVLMILDWFTGVLLAVYRHRVSSEMGRRGLIRKVQTILLLLAAYALQISVHLSWDLVSPVASAFCLNEIISITENVARTGVWIPQPLLEVLLQAKRITGRGRNQAELEKDLDQAAKSKAAGEDV